MIEPAATLGFSLIFIGLLWFLLGLNKPQRSPMPKKPLPPELQPKLEPTVPVADDDPLRPHLFELIAAAVNNGAKVRWWNLTNLKAGAVSIGSWRITVERIDD